MKEILLQLLETFGVPVIQQGTLAPEESYPPDFITFDITDSQTTACFDDNDIMTAWEITIDYYSVSPVKVSTVPQDIRTVLKQNGFIPQGRGYNLISDEPTHTAWTQTFNYLEQNAGGII